MNGEGDNLFTFVWEIKNWHMKKFDKLQSPKCNIKKFLNTTWYLEITYNWAKDTPTCSLGRHKCSEGPNEIKINFNVIARFSMDYTTFENKQTDVFKKGSLIMYNDVFCDKNLIGNYSNKTIYFICQMAIDKSEIINHIWKISDQLLSNYLSLPLTTVYHLKSKFEHADELKYLQNVQELFFCFSSRLLAKTVVTTEKNKFKWSMEYILNSRSKYITFVAEFTNFPDLFINMYITQENTISMKILRKVTCTHNFWLICILWISDFDETIYCSEQKLSFLSDYDDDEEEEEKKDLELILKTKNLYLNKRIDLKTCSLHLEINISSGDSFSCTEKEFPVNFLNLNLYDEKNIIDDFPIKMENMYLSRLYCDVTIQVPNKKFEAHKSVLCTNSPVFTTMIESKSEENKTNLIVIDDMDEDTTDHMLKFMYSGTFKDKGFEANLKLYEAAIKYKMLTLQNKCALTLKSNLTVKRALLFLSLSDAHGDKELKSHVLSFIMLHIKEILVLEEWKVFSKSSNILAKKILEKVCMKLAGLNKLKSNVIA